MRRIIIDTNIVFSALLNTNGTIGDLLFNSDDVFEFYSCSYMPVEIEKHWNKLKQISKLSEKELKEAQFKLFRKINFINESIISQKTWLAAELTVKNIDIDDVDFVALTSYLKGYLWTGDKKLYNGLKKKGFRQVYNATELLEYRKRKE